MPEPIYSRRYPRGGERGRVKEAEPDFLEDWSYPHGQLRRDFIFGKVVEVTNRNNCDVDIFEGNKTMLVKVYFDFPCNILELDGALGMANMISINSAKEGHDAVLSVFYDLQES